MSKKKAEIILLLGKDNEIIGRSLNVDGMPTTFEIVNKTFRDYKKKI